MSGPSEDEVREWETAVKAEADRHSGVVLQRLGPFYEDDNRLVRLPDVKAAPSPADTETLLNGLIEDCRFLIREVAFHSARLTPDPNDRLRFLSSAESLASTGAKIATAIATLRAGPKPEPVSENRYRMIVEHVQSAPPGGGEEQTP